MQIVGTSCAICQQRISAVIDGRYCPACKVPFHSACQSEIGACPSCKANLAAADAIEKRQQLTDPSKITSGRDLSFCCIQCGSPSVTEVKLINLTYLPKWSWYFIATGFFWLPLYLYLRRTASLTIGLCSEHKGHLQLFKAFGYSLLLIGPLLIFIGVQSENLLLQFIGASMLVVFVPVVRFATPVAVTNIDRDLITLAERHYKALQRTRSEQRASER